MIFQKNKVNFFIRCNDRRNSDVNILKRSRCAKPVCITPKGFAALMNTTVFSKSDIMVEAGAVAAMAAELMFNVLNNVQALKQPLLLEFQCIQTMR